MLTPSFPPMQVQQLLQMKKQQQAAQQKAGQPQQTATAVQQKVRGTRGGEASQDLSQPVSTDCLRLLQRQQSHFTKGK